MAQRCFYLVEVFDYAPGEVPLVFDGWLYQLVEVIGTDLKCLKHPGKSSTKQMGIKMISNLAHYTNL